MMMVLNTACMQMVFEKTWWEIRRIIGSSPFRCYVKKTRVVARHPAHLEGGFVKAGEGSAGCVGLKLGGGEAAGGAVCPHICAPADRWAGIGERVDIEQ